MKGARPSLRTCGRPGIGSTPTSSPGSRGRLAVHSYHFSQGKVGGLDVMSDSDLDNLPPVEHPVVRILIPTRAARASTSAATRATSSGRMSRPAASCSRRCARRRAVRPGCSPTAGKVGDLVMWDNRCVLHRGRPYPPDQPREMSRTTVAGDVRRTTSGCSDGVRASAPVGCGNRQDGKPALAMTECAPVTGSAPKGGSAFAGRLRREGG